MHPTLLTALVEDRMATLRRDAELAGAVRRRLELGAVVRAWRSRRQTAAPLAPRPAFRLQAASGDCADCRSDAA